MKYSIELEPLKFSEEDNNKTRHANGFKSSSRYVSFWINYQVCKISDYPLVYKCIAIVQADTTMAYNYREDIVQLPKDEVILGKAFSFKDCITICENHRNRMLNGN